MLTYFTEEGVDDLDLEIPSGKQKKPRKAAAKKKKAGKKRAAEEVEEPEEPGEEQEDQAEEEVEEADKSPQKKKAKTDGLNKKEERGVFITHMFYCLIIPFYSRFCVMSSCFLASFFLHVLSDFFLCFCEL